MSELTTDSSLVFCPEKSGVLIRMGSSSAARPASLELAPGREEISEEGGKSNGMWV